jgi:glycosyltransferase involved in cell wall biosynthesis
VARHARGIDADVLFAFKPLSTSLWTGFAARRRLRVPLFLDIEDWELGWYLDGRPLDAMKHLVRIRRANGMAWTAVNERLVGRADEVFVASTSLQRRFGGTVLPHGPDTAVFDPDRWPREEALARLGLPDAAYVVFTGSPMRNKGIEDVLDGIRALGRPDVRMLLVGSFRHDPAFREELVARYKDVLTLLPPASHADMPLFLAVATVVVLAQRASRETDAQVPAKVYEAMAMARPILATSVSDLPLILEGCGRVVPPGDRTALLAALDELLGDAGERERLGRAARARCEARYGWDAMERILNARLERFEA